MRSSGSVTLVADVDPPESGPSTADPSAGASGPDLTTIALLVFFISLIVIVAVLLLLPVLAG